MELQGIAHDSWWLQVADAWSKVVENSEWIMNQEVYEELESDEVLDNRKPALDVFASSATTKVPGACHSMYMCPSSKSTNTMVHPCAFRGCRREHACGLHQWSIPPHEVNSIKKSRMTEWIASWWDPSGLDISSSAGEDANEEGGGA